MARFTLQLRLLTPAFVGAQQSRVCDPITPLRPPSLRGQWRWWFRALASTVLWPQGRRDHDETELLGRLRKVETALFGATDQASALSLQPTTGAVAKGQRIPDRSRARGLRYLGYGLFEGLEPQAIEPGGGIRVPLALRERPEDRRLPELLAALLWTWARCGGVGARWRRGFGSLVLTDLGGLPWAGPALQTEPDVETLLDRTNVGLEHALDLFRGYFREAWQWPVEQGPGPHPAIRTLDGLKAIRALPFPYPTPFDALEQAGRLFQDFRSTLCRRDLGMAPLADYHEVKAALQGERGAPRHVDRAAFGLPLPFYFRSLHGARTVVRPEHGDRLASPLLFRVQPVGPPDRELFAVLLLDLAECNDALPLLGQRMRVEGRSVPPPDRAILRDFIAWAQQRARTLATREGRT